MKLVDKEKLEKALNTLVNSGHISDGAYNEVWNKMGACLVFPTELAEQAKEDRRKARMWDIVYRDHSAFLGEALRQKQEEIAKEKT